MDPNIDGGVIDAVARLPGHSLVAKAIARGPGSQIKSNRATTAADAHADCPKSSPLPSSNSSDVEVAGA
jgi:hypothetical protein